MNTLLRQIPAIHELQQDSRSSDLLNKGFSVELVTEWIQASVSELRQELLQGLSIESSLITNIIFEKVKERLTAYNTTNLQRVINATGTVLHTNLGRAKLSQEAIDQVIDVAGNYSNLEYNLEKGQRGSRHDIIEDLVKQVTGAEAAMVVNNNAAAVYLVLKALARDKEVIVSRGELVEIGGSFRVSSIMEESGASLVEVGTTNKTHFYDYEQAITENTAMIMKVHTSNFKTIGFTSDVAAKQLAPLTQSKDILLYEDLGSGALFDLRTYQIGEEPTVKESLQQGADIVTFSGDKLLGGPQAGIIAGKKRWIQKLKKHQLARVLRVDKMTLAALEATFKAYQDEKQAKQLPTMKAILLTEDEIKEKAEHFREKLSKVWNTELIKDVSMVGGGTMPAVELNTYLLLLSNEHIKAQNLHEQLRMGNPAVVTRLKENCIALDFRTIDDKESVDLLVRLQEFEPTNS
ncbi:L-seryl-tRNA(Sec) selenium transferase [Halalkalibacter urbisdiaboli]|uniref:L-seryl-tRNA(Sec) selenium transferase n=1 Tax=Halalkalibacter urbisdiaboli TaxID=1960589 RepID=UPI000B42F014|nr:L-seryl-tRNA(Sec) selenium transferase [Halalkalibacter urbisdiaboli]